MEENVTTNVELDHREKISEELIALLESDLEPDKLKEKLEDYHENDVAQVKSAESTEKTLE